MERTNPLAHLSAQIQGGADTALQLRFVLMQAIAGALISSVRFTLTFGVVGSVDATNETRRKQHAN
jgi:hypothetical protein